MSDESPKQEQSQDTGPEPVSQETSKPSSSQEAIDAWRQVGRQIQALGTQIASAFETSVQSEETQEQLEKLRAELESATDQLSQAAKDVAESEEGKKVQAETVRFMETAQASSEELIKEVRPQLLAAFQQMRSGLDQIISNLEQQSSSTKKTSSDQEKTTTPD